jgi:rhodanese-related sulfurtransferase
MTKFGLQQNALMQQGYSTYSGDKLRSMSNGLRFTPLLCMFLAIYGMFVLQNPYWHFGIAALGILPFWFPSAHPLDLLYNHVVRHVFRSEKLPQNPLPRRIACVMGGLMNVGIGLSFLYQNVLLVYVLGVALVVLQLVVITTHICVASWMYEGLLKMIGKYEGPISISQTKSLLEKGFQLVDVRTPEEYQGKRIDGAINIPLNSLENCDHIPKNGVILYCRSGMRSLDAAQRLKKMGYNHVVNFGAMDRWHA